MHADFTEFEGEGWSVLMLSIDELRTIAVHELDDRLGLWRFAAGLNELPLPGYGTVTSVVDAYALYLECRRRPRRLGISDTPVASFLVGYGASLTVDHRRQTDVHAAQRPDSSEVVLVSREAVSDAVRVYIPQREDLRHLRLVELPLPCWVGAHGAGEQSQWFCAGVADAVALHLWRIRDIIGTYLSAIAEDASLVAIDIVDPDASSLSFAGIDNAADTLWFEIAVDRKEHRITVRLRPNAAVRLSQVADRAEGTLVAELARALASLAGRPSDIVDTDLAEFTAHDMPRFMYVGTGYVPGVHGGASLPGCRLKHHVELDAGCRRDRRHLRPASVWSTASSPRSAASN